MISTLFKTDETLTEKEEKAIADYKQFIEQSHHTIANQDENRESVKVDGDKVYIFDESGEVVLETTLIDWEINKNNYIKKYKVTN